MFSKNAIRIKCKKYSSIKYYGRRKPFIKKGLIFRLMCMFVLDFSFCVHKPSAASH